MDLVGLQNRFEGLERAVTKRITVLETRFVNELNGLRTMVFAMRGDLQELLSQFASTGVTPEPSSKDCKCTTALDSGVLIERPENVGVDLSSGKGRSVFTVLIPSPAPEIPEDAVTALALIWRGKLVVLCDSSYSKELSEVQKEQGVCLEEVDWAESRTLLVQSLTREEQKRWKHRHD